MSKTVFLLLTAILMTGLAGCGGQPEEDSAGDGGEASTTDAVDQGSAGSSTEEERVPQEDTVRETTRSGAAPERPQETTEPRATTGATLQIGGEPGLRFSGSCTVDGEERGLEGRVPQTYTYEPGERIRCEISSLQRGSLRVSFSDGEGADTLQQVGPQPATIELTYTEGSLSTSTRSSSQNSSQSSSQSTSQTSSQSSSSSISSSQSSQSSSSVTRSGSE